MDKDAKEVIDRHPHTKRNDVETSDSAEGSHQALQPQTLDQKPEDIGSEHSWMTPSTSSSEDADQSDDGAVVIMSSRVGKKTATDIVSVADEQPSSHPNGEIVRSDQDGRGLNGAAQTEPELQPIYDMNSADTEAKDGDKGASETEDGNNEDQTTADIKGNDDPAPDKEAGQSMLQDEAENEERDEDEEGDEAEGKDENKETESSLSKEPETNPAEIELPNSPYFNPFDAPGADVGTGSRRGSIDGIPPLEDEAHVEPFVGSPANREWTRRKEQLGEKNEALDKVMEMVGLEAAKAAFLEVKDMIDASRSRKGHLKRQALNMVIMGNPGTGTDSQFIFTLLFIFTTLVVPEIRQGHMNGLRATLVLL